jgi:D-3-phosphoglycerate dehydrogenase / 2-oxoglutarate reductase
MTLLASIVPSTAAIAARWRASFVDAGPALADLFERLHRADDPPLHVNRQPDVRPDGLPALLDGAPIAIIDHTALPTPVAARCAGLKHVVFLGTGARSYMDPEALAGLGIAVHTIKGYGDTAVAECAFALMWAAARGLARMDRELREGRWLRTDGLQLRGKTLGLIGFGGIAQELARLALGAGMHVVAWNRSPRAHAGVEFVGIDTLLATSHVVSLHLLLTDETRSFLSRERIDAMRDGAILVNTARGALLDEAALVDALTSGKLAHAGLDVFTVEPLPAQHPFTTLPNVTLSAHSAFRTPEASINLVEAALAHCRRIAADSGQA